MRRAIGPILLLVILAGTAWIIYRDPQIRSALGAVAMLDIAGLIGLSAATLLFLAYQQMRVLGNAGLLLGLGTNINLLATQVLGNQLLPVRGGTILRGIQLRYLHGFSFLTFAGLSLAINLLQLLIACVIAAIAMALFGEWIWSLALLLLGAAPPAVLMILGRRSERDPMETDRSGPKAIAARFMDGCTGLFSSSPLLWISVMISVLVFALRATRLGLAFHVVGATGLQWHEVVSIQAALSISGIVALLPGNLGIREGIATFVAQRFGTSASQAFSAAVFDRIAVMVASFLLCLVTWRQVRAVSKLGSKESA